MVRVSIRGVALGVVVAAAIATTTPATTRACTADDGMLAHPFEVGRFAFIGTLTRTTHGTETVYPTSHAFQLERALRGNLPSVLTLTVQDGCHSFDHAMAAGNRVIVATATLADLSVSSSLLWVELGGGKLQVYGDVLNFPPPMRAPAEVMTEAEVLDYIGGLPDTRPLIAESQPPAVAPVDRTSAIESWLPVLAGIAVVVISIFAFRAPRRTR